MVALGINGKKSAVVLQILSQCDQQEVSATVSEKTDNICSFKDDLHMLCHKKPSPLYH